MSKNLQKQIENKLDQLQKLLDSIDEVRIIQSGEPETWDVDTLYNLKENLKKALALLENKTSLKEKDPWGEPLILEEGLCSLMNACLENPEEEYE